MLRKIISISIGPQMALWSAWADNLTSGFARPDDIKGAGFGSVFVSGQQPGAVLIKVNLWGAVAKSGIHYVPHNTDFVSLLSYAGGPTGAADLQEAYIKRRTRDTEEIIPVNIKDIVGIKSAHNPIIEPNDIVVIPEVVPLISNNTVLTTGFIASVLSVVITTIILSDQVKGN